MDDFATRGNETLYLLMGFLVLLAGSSLLILWALRAIFDENADNETPQRAYESTLLTYGAFLPHYVPIILANKPHSTDDETKEAAPQGMNPLPHFIASDSEVGLHS
ncbi:hypothetical protein [Brucella pituitosa]|uniref:hypothetical protein n=1 Tax=Brucella pituitosa TaxID=571256 RepID=UPI0009A2007F|nr:hypothetical protein [Brucella pituitosa]